MNPLILGVFFLALLGSANLLAQVSPHPLQPFSKYQQDVDAVANAMLADRDGLAVGQPLPRAIPPVQAVLPEGRRN